MDCHVEYFGQIFTKWHIQKNIFRLFVCIGETWDVYQELGLHMT